LHAFWGAAELARAAVLEETLPISPIPADAIGRFLDFHDAQADNSTFL